MRQLSVKENDQRGLVELLKVNSLNINGYNVSNAELKKKLFLYGNPDFVCISETHLKNRQEIVIPGYKWFGKNRSECIGKKGSGGVGILVSDSVYQNYSVTVTANDTDGILGIRVTNRYTDYSTVLVCNYLPPADSPYGSNADMFFNRLLELVYETNDDDGLLLCGDLNARIGAKKDIISDQIGIPNRENVDDKINSHGCSFLEFLKTHVAV